MIKIIDVKLINQTVLVGSLVNIEVEVMENNWLHIFSKYNSWSSLRSYFLNWNDIKNI